MYLGLSAGILVLAGLLVASMFYPDLTKYSGYFSLPFMYAIYGYWSAGKSRKRLLDQGVVEGLVVPKPFDDRRLVLLLVITIFSSAAVSGYLLANPIRMTYSGYGMSFQYPPSMIISESRVGNLTVSESVGMLSLKSRDGKDAASLLWVVNPTTIDLNAVIDDASSSILSEPDYTDVSLGVKSRVIMSCGFEAVVQNISLKGSGQPYYLVNAAWFDPSQVKMYMLMVASPSSEYTCTSFRQGFFESFIVNTDGT